MRFAGFAILAVVVALAPLAAHAQGASTGTVFSGFTCRQHVPCNTSDASFPSSQGIAALTDACVAQNMGGVKADLFDEIAGLDGSDCLTTKTEKLTPVAGIVTTPQCCLAHLSENVCAIHCNMVDK